MERKVDEMKNETVKELIERLKLLNQDNIVCKVGLSSENDDSAIFTTFESCKQFENVTYIDDGNKKIGNIVTFY